MHLAGARSAPAPQFPLQLKRRLNSMRQKMICSDKRPGYVDWYLQLIAGHMCHSVTLTCRVSPVKTEEEAKSDCFLCWCHLVLSFCSCRRPVTQSNDDANAFIINSEPCISSERHGDVSAIWQRSAVYPLWLYAFHRVGACTISLGFQSVWDPLPVLCLVSS